MIIKFCRSREAIYMAYLCIFRVAT